MKRATTHTVVPIALCVLLWLAPDAARRGAKADSVSSLVDRAVLMNVVRALSSPEFEGRAAGTPGGARARAFIAREFRERSLEPVGANGGFFQEVDLTHACSSNGRMQSGTSGAANVVGFLNGRQAGARAIVVSAHYDHLGTVDGVLHPGADDNASGVAVLLAAASHFANHRPRHDFIFVAFDAEELNMAGSTWFVARPPIPLSRLQLVVNLDMVSRSDRREIYAAGTSHHPALRPVLDDVRRRAPVKLLFGHDRPEEGREDWTQDSDHWPFHNAGVPFVYFGVEDHVDYHRPTDTADRIDVTFFGDVADTILATVIALDARLD